MENILEQNFISILEISSTIIISLWFKEVASNFVNGCLFYFNKSLNEGDEIFIDEEKALIVKIGLRVTIFEICSENGTKWRYVQNTRIPYLKLEKIVKSKEIKEMEDKNKNG